MVRIGNHQQEEAATLNDGLGVDGLVDQVDLSKIIHFASTTLPASGHFLLLCDAPTPVSVWGFGHQDERHKGDSTRSRAAVELVLHTVFCPQSARLPSPVMVRCVV